MNVIRNLRLGVFEILLLVALGVIGWAAYQTFQAIQMTGERLRIEEFRQMLSVSLLVMTGLLGWLMLVTYRRVVVPLRSKLIESDAIIEGQRKLATYGKHAAGVAHEIRTPLTTMKARVFTLQKTLGRNTSEYRDATIIDTEINRLDRIVTDFLTLGRPALPHLVPVSADALLREVGELFKPQCQRQSIQLRFDTVVDTPFLGDIGQLKQVLINLVRNAAESIGQGGTISLRARADRWRLNQQLTAVVILEVHDTGAGIPLEVQPRLFDPFFTTKERGTGLGLSIAAEIVHKHGGMLIIHLHPGQGATVGVVLPSLGRNHE